jgi:hypothetical protein
VEIEFAQDHQPSPSFQGDLTDPEVRAQYSHDSRSLGSGVFYLRSPDLTESSAFVLNALTVAVDRHAEGGLPVLQGFQYLQACAAAAWKFAVRPISYPESQALWVNGTDNAPAHFWLPTQDNYHFEELLSSLCSGSTCYSPGEFCGGDLPKLCRCCPTPGGLYLCQ